MKTSSHSPVADKTMWDTIGNKCRVEMFNIGIDTFEVYFHDLNSDIPTRFIGSIGICNNKVDRWIDLKKEAGFQEQLPSYNLATIV